MSSTCWRIMEEVQVTLRGMTFGPVPGEAVQPIPYENIIILKPGLSAKEEEENLSAVPTPGLVITPPKSVICPPTGGTNARDDVIYAVLIQIVDNDNQARVDSLQTYLMWQEKIRHAMNARSWLEVEIALYGDVYQSFAENTNVVDARLWKRVDKFVAGVGVAFTVRETRGQE